MTRTPDERADQLELLRALARAHARIAGDVAMISKGVWAIHGVIAVDGDEILAEFDTYDEARTVLAQLPVGSA